MSGKLSSQGKVRGENFRERKRRETKAMGDFNKKRKLVMVDVYME